MMRRLLHSLGRLAIAVVQAAIVGAMLALPLKASQAPLFNPTSGTLSGLSMVQNQNNANDALATCNAGGSAPTTQFLSGVPSTSDCWDDTSTGGWVKHKVYVGSQWVVTAYYDLTNSLYTGIVGGGASAAVASAATTDLCSVNGPFVFITGSATVTSFGTSCALGQWKRFFINTGGGASPTFVYNSSSLLLPGGANIASATGDTGDAVYTEPGQWIVTSYTRATGVPPGAASLSGADQTLSGGANVTAFNIGTVSSGTATIDCGKSPLQYLTNGGAFAIGAPANDGSCIVLITNNASAGSIGSSGFTLGANIGDSVDTVNGHRFMISITRINGVATFISKALQ